MWCVRTIPNTNRFDWYIVLFSYFPCRMIRWFLWTWTRLLVLMTTSELSRWLKQHRESVSKILRKDFIEIVQLVIFFNGQVDMSSRQRLRLAHDIFDMISDSDDEIKFDECGILKPVTLCKSTIVVVSYIISTIWYCWIEHMILNLVNWRLPSFTKPGSWP